MTDWTLLHYQQTGHATFTVDGHTDLCQTCGASYDRDDPPSRPRDRALTAAVLLTSAALTALLILGALDVAKDLAT